MMPDVSIVVPTYNRKEKLRRLLESILSDVRCSYEIIVVDDCSTDGTDEMIKNLFPQVKYIRHNDIELVGKSRNDGILNSSSEYVFFVDDDNVVPRNTVEMLLQIIRNDTSIGVVAPVTCYLSVPEKVMYAGAKFDRFMFRSRFLFVKSDASELTGKVIEIDKAANSYMIRKSAVESAGLIDYPRYAVFEEEGELIYKIKLKSYRTLVTGEARVFHDVPFEETVTYDKIKEFRAYFSIRSKLFFTRDFSPGILKIPGLIFTIFVAFPHYAFRYVIPARSKRFKMAKALLFGMIDGLVGNEKLRYR